MSEEKPLNKSPANDEVFTANARIDHTDQEENDDRPLTGTNIPERMQYYQTRFDQDSSDDDGDSRHERQQQQREHLQSTQEYKSSHRRRLLDDENSDEDNEEGEEDEQNEYAPLETEYAPLDDEAYQQLEEEFGDFQASSIAAQLTDTSIDSIIRGTLSRVEFTPRGGLNDNELFGGESKVSSSSNLPVPPRARRPVETTAVAAAEDWQPFAGTAPLQMDENATTPISTQPPNIPPLTEEKISTIKNVMSRFTLKPPSLASAAMADAFEHSKFRVGDEVPK